jgi:3-hydroxyacyl-CoA dehydrogenase
MLAAGYRSFYRREHGAAMQYSPLAKAYVPVREAPTASSVAVMRSGQRVVERNDDASLHDLGDGVALLEFHSKANTYTPKVFELSWKALERLEAGFDALVIGNQGPMFCAGLNLTPFVAEGEALTARVEWVVREFPGLLQAIRFAPKPIVAAPFDRTLGGGAETCLAAHRIVASAELAMGLVETGVGLIPAAGGCKELLRRVLNPVMRIENADPLPVLQSILMQIGQAKISGSAREACAMGFLAAGDRIVSNRDHLLGEAKREARHLADSGFRPPRPEKIYAAGRDTLAALHMMLFQMREANQISEHDLLIASKLAWVLCGGDLSAPAWVDEQYILDLERQAFVFLIQQPRTAERMKHTLKTGKPLRN